jgi:hypothetical protein
MSLHSSEYPKVSQNETLLRRSLGLGTSKSHTCGCSDTDIPLLPKIRCVERRSVMTQNSLVGSNTVLLDKYHLTKWSGVLPHKLTVTHTAKKFPDFYGTRRFITVLTTARHWSLFWAWWIQSITSHAISLRPILILPYHLRLCLQNGLVPSDFLFIILNVFLISCVLHVPPISYLLI